MRTVTFSNEDLAKEMNETFVSAWVNKHPRHRYEPNPQKVNELTLGTGITNVTSVFATADGKVLHAVPGYMDRSIFRREMKFALQLNGALVDAEGRWKEDAEKTYVLEHADRAGVLKTGYPLIAEVHRTLAKEAILRVEKLKEDYFNYLRNRFDPG